MSTVQALCYNKAPELTRYTYSEFSVSILSGTSDLQNQAETRQINDWHQLPLRFVILTPPKWLADIILQKARLE